MLELKIISKCREAQNIVLKYIEFDWIDHKIPDDMLFVSINKRLRFLCMTGSELGRYFHLDYRLEYYFEETEFRISIVNRFHNEINAPYSFEIDCNTNSDNDKIKCDCHPDPCVLDILNINYTNLTPYPRYVGIMHPVMNNNDISQITRLYHS